ncbi:MAG: nitrile hydratase accessory protein [Pseudomonadota bacterium]
MRGSPILSTPDAAPFDQPWQAQAFALTEALIAAEAFSASEWAEALSRELHGPDAAEDGSDYYARWVRALEGLMISRGIATAEGVARLTTQWQRAAERTPHGHAITLEAGR